jgi:hypothetical protein
MRVGLVRSNSLSRRSAGALLFIGVLAGVSVGGGIGVIAASSTKTVTVCANKKTNVLRYAKNGKCAKIEIKVLLNQTVEAAGGPGVAGANGAKGDTGAKGDAGVAGTNGAKGDTGAAGAKGDTGAAGAKGDTGAAGTNGTNGVTGTNGTNGTNGIGSFVPRSVCGSNGTTLCAFGLQGPGGGWIFYVDTEGKYSDFDYLEAAPTDGLFASSATSGVWSTTTLKCGLNGNESCRTNWLTTSGDAIKYWGLGTGRAATAAIVARHDAGGVAKNLYAAGVADAYTTSTATDWWLPSDDEGVLMENLYFANLGGLGGLTGNEIYFSSTEATATLVKCAVNCNGFEGKIVNIRVRPVRGF